MPSRDSFTAYLYSLDPAEVEYRPSGSGPHVLKITRDVGLFVQPVADDETAATVAGLRKLAEEATRMADALSARQEGGDD